MSPDAADSAPAPRAVIAAAEAPRGSQNALETALANAPGQPARAIPAAPPVTGPALRPDAPLSYTVKRGDTLWGISALFLRDPWLWPEIWHVNPAVRNPHLIYPGDVLTLAYGPDGEPQIRLARDGEAAVRVQPLVRSAPLDGPIATIPYEAIAAFLGRPSIVSKDDLLDAPRVAGLRDGHLIGGTGHEVYVKGLDGTAPGRYAVVRAGEQLKDPETGRVLGYMGIFTASARTDRTDAVTKALLTESVRETVTGDLLFADTARAAAADIIPRAAPDGLGGQIMAVVDGVSMIGQYKVVAVNRGLRHGLQAGHVLAVDQKGEAIRDGTCKRSALSWCVGRTLQVPDERAGTLLVFKTYDDMSYGLIVEASVPIRVADVVRTP